MGGRERRIMEWKSSLYYGHKSPCHSCIWSQVQIKKLQKQKERVGNEVSETH